MTDLEPISKRIPNAKHRLFIDELFKHNMNQARAYQATYPDSSEDAARAAASRLLTNVNIRDEIERRLKENAMSANEVISRLADFARGSLGDFTNVKTREDLEAHPLAHLVKKYNEILQEDAQGRARVRLDFELHDAHRALQDLGKYHSLFSDNNNVPQEVITYTIDEWRAEQERRKQEANQALEDFED